MSSRARRLGGALPVIALLALLAATVAWADSPPPVKPTQSGKLRNVGQSSPTSPAPATPTAGGVHATAVRLAAKLGPSSGTSTATGHWDGILVHTIGTIKSGTMGPGCAIVGGKSNPHAPRPGIPQHTIHCGPGVPPFAVPNGQHWVLGWRLTYSSLSSAVSGAKIVITAPTGSAPVAAAPLCSSCTSGRFGRLTLTDDQANAILKGEGSVVVSTANNPGGEISGPILKQTAPGAIKH